jgi:DNA helicase-2/ATP-dependent DNA helicase PcrA
MLKTIEELLDELNENQRKAAEHIDGPVLVLAGAGSGKTKTLTYRIANMISRHNVSPRNLFVATFTNKAAQEMKQRIASVTSQETINNLWAGTFHSLCVKILRIFSSSVGYDNKFTIYDQSDSESLCQRVLTFMKKEEEISPKDLMYYISNCKNKLITPSIASKQVTSPENETLATAYFYYQNILKESNSMDFDDLILNVVLILQSNIRAKSWANDRFKYIMCDEYQDVNYAQFKLLSLLTGNNNNIFVIGDDYQSIYGFRGSDVEHILQFKNQFENSKVYTLDKNYRSTSNIVQAGSSIIKKNKNQLDKEIVSNKGEGQPIVTIEFDDDYKESAFISWLIQEKINKESNVKYSDFAILYRVNSQSSSFEKIFINSRIPYKIVGGIGFYQREEIKDIVAYLRFIHNNKDDEALLRILNKPTRGIGKNSQEIIKEYANQNKVSVYRSLLNADDIGLPKKSLGKIKDFLILVEHLNSKKDMHISTFVKYIIDQTGYRKMWEEKKTEEAYDKIENIKQFEENVYQYQIESDDSSFDSFLQDISLLSSYDSETQDCVQLMTMHASKGLEFPYVFIIGMNEGIFPSWRCENEKDVEEERRLAYVGITRAEKELYLTWVKLKHSFGGKTKPVIPSRFLKEIDESLIKNIELNK